MHWQPDVVVAGHVCLDFIPRFADEPRITPGQLNEVGPLTIRAGGCVANTGLDLAALGTSVGLAATIGDDRVGHLLLALLDRPGADCSAVQMARGGETSYSIVVEPPGGDRAFWHHVGANATFDGHGVDASGARIVHIGYPPALPGLHANGGAALIALLERCRGLGATTSIDLSTFTASSPVAAEPWPELIDRLLALTDVFAASVDDLRCAYGTERTATSADSLVADLVARGPAVVLLKRGAEGLHLATAGTERLARAGRGFAGLGATWADNHLHAPSIPVAVVSTTGAGDAAVAGLLHSINAGMDAPAALRASALTAAARISSHDGLADWPTISERWSDESTVTRQPEVRT